MVIGATRDLDLSCAEKRFLSGHESAAQHRCAVTVFHGSSSSGGLESRSGWR